MLKQSAALDKALLKKSSLDIPLVPETVEDKKMASLLSMKLKPSRSISQSTKLVRQKMLSQSSLPTSSFTPTKEAKAIKMLSNSNKDLGIVKKGATNDAGHSGSKKPKLSGSLVDYATSSDSD